MKLLSTLLALAALTVAGCGGDDDETTTATTTGATGEAGATGEEGAAGGDFEAALRADIDTSDTVGNVDFTCEDEIPPPDGEEITCDATGETSDGAEGKGTLTLTTEGETVNYEVEIKAGNTTSTQISSIGADGGEASGGSLLEP